VKRNFGGVEHFIRGVREILGRGEGVIGGVKRSFGGVEHFIRVVREILGGVAVVTPSNPSSKSVRGQ
jgi:hypothetical protein